MLSALYPDINWETIDVVGFDMDGTLYDEFDFIIQVYSVIIARFEAVISNHLSVLNHIKDQWLEKGSSYGHFFEEIYDGFIQDRSISRDDFVKESLHIYRSFKPELELSARSIRLLEFFFDCFDLFLVTDGSYPLQLSKFESLGLSKFFKKENCIFTGRWGSRFYKPDIGCIDHIGMDLDGKRVLFIGDREMDRKFALNAGFDFLKVYNMIPTNVRGHI